jgi:membrane carboxypeptidase/penicillin-binding protein
MSVKQHYGIRKSQTHVQYRESTLVVQQEQKAQSTQSEQGSLTTVVLQHRGPENTPLAEVRQCQVTRANLRLALAEEEFPARPDELGVRDELELNSRAVPRAENALVVVDPNDADSLSDGTAVQHGLIALL